MKLPINIIPKQNNYTDTLNDFAASYNLDLTSGMGKIRVSPRMVLNQDSADVATMGVPCAFKSFETTGTLAQWWMIGGTNLFYSLAGLNGTITKFTGSPADPSGFMDADYSDLEIFDGELYMTEADRAINYVKADFTCAGINNAVATAAGFHGMTYFRATNKLYIVDDSSRSISVMATGHTPTNAAATTQYTLYRIVDGTEVIISWIRATSSRIWIGTINFNGNGSYIYSWDGSQYQGPNESYKINAAGSYACVIKDDVPWVVDTEGRLLAFNGGTFVEKDRFPFDLAQGKYLPYLAKGTNRPIHYNGIDLVNGRINILVNAAPYDTGHPASSLIEKFNSGIWEYTPETGLYHKSSLGNTKSGGTINDYGQQKMKYVGALGFIKMPRLGQTAGSINGTLVAGGEYYTNASSSAKGVWYDDFANTLQKAGYFVTAKIFSPNISETWQKIYIRFRKFLSATDKIVIKYRTTESEPTEATITYTSTTAFTVPTASFTTAPAVGNEVEILQGVGAGRTAHITAISTNGSNYEVTVDETITGATTQTAKARFQAWKKIGSYSSQSDDFLKFPITEGNTATWIQFKVWILWTGKDEIYDLIISSKENELIE